MKKMFLFCLAALPFGLAVVLGRMGMLDQKNCVWFKKIHLEWTHITLTSENSVGDGGQPRLQNRLNSQLLLLQVLSGQSQKRSMIIDDFKFMTNIVIIVVFGLLMMFPWFSEAVSWNFASSPSAQVYHQQASVDVLCLQWKMPGLHLQCTLQRQCTISVLCCQCLSHSQICDCGLFLVSLLLVSKSC